METRFFKYYKGKRYYQVFRNEVEEIFTGTACECRRYLKVHREKVKKYQARDQRRGGKNIYVLTRSLCVN